MNDGALVQLSRAKLALAECKTAMESKQIADIAEAARVYLERTNASVDTVNQATEVRLLAERQMGAFLKEMPKAKGGRDFQTRSRDLQVDPPTLAEIGITRIQSSDAQKLASIPEPEFQERIAVAKASGGRLSTAKVLSPESAPKPVSSPTPEPSSWANEYASMAINQLQKISRSDPKRPDALRRVMEWIAAELNK